ncbi:hypothetical protein F0562_031785 [Nyssa sinensis]|uniref:F-box associated beta-propeller type 3 domain-containing protein n=1 Tax=Nyssa sinensis TaxID=561372 RepID=A0A5J5AVG5_9ASTE|nr:hypothetical protein F0562_031785 [Nyssa sinensis]
MPLSIAINDDRQQWWTAPKESGDNIEGMKIPYADLGRRIRYDSWFTTCASTGGLMAYFKFIKKCYFICNPIIGEEVEVPMVPYDFYKEHSGPTWWGFGYSLSTKEYKLVHIGLPILYDDPKGIVWGVIYTLGSKSWRVIPHVPFPPVYQGNVESDGTLFWLICKGLYKGGTENIGSFDVRSENFRAWQGPLVDLNINEACYYLVKLGDNIAFVRDNYSLNRRIWVLRDKENELWINEYNLISSVPSSLFRKDFQVICLWVNGELLAITQYKKTCIAYDAKKMELKKVTLPNFGENAHGNSKRLHFVISHAGSLISPRRIMEMGKKFSIDKE